MPEPISWAAVLGAVSGALSGAIVAAITTRWGIETLTGVLFGAMIYMVRSKESSWVRRLMYFAFALIAGYFIAPALAEHFPLIPAFLSGVLSSVGVVLIAIAVLDFLDENAKEYVRRIAEFLFGLFTGGRKRD